MRGKVKYEDLMYEPKGITPAYAGKRHNRTYQQGLERDHPRVCGEKKRIHRCRTKSLGSPPRMRGKVHDRGKVAVLLGITPAYAGKSMILADFKVWPLDHPRVCGEKVQTMLLRRFALGSPPRMRGKVKRNIFVALAHGITPAYAGKRNETCGVDGLNGDHPRVCGEKRVNARTCARVLGSPPRMRGKACPLF